MLQVKYVPTVLVFHVNDTNVSFFNAGDKNLALISVRPKERYTKRVICMRVKLCAGVLIESNVETQVYTNYISPFVTFCDVMGWTSQAPGNRRSQWSTMKTDAHTKINLRTIIEKNQN